MDVIDFGLRRAQGPDGAISASRAAYIGGVSGSSNLLAGKQFGIPVRGTHAHSWIMAFDSEEVAFAKYAENLPDDCVLLVDTYETLRGVDRAIEVGKAMRERGSDLAGIRIDSGDLAYLSQEARRRLDEAGFSKTKIVASNELDEYLIQSLNLQGAKVDMWGVGTNLVTGKGQGALNGVYKLAAIFELDHWVHKIKVSDQPSKTTNPGLHNVRRYVNAQGGFEGDLIYDESEDPSEIKTIVDPTNPLRKKKISQQWSSHELLQPVFRNGTRIYDPPPFSSLQSRTKEQLARLHPGHKRFENPHEYPVGLSPFLSELKQTLIGTHGNGDR